MQFGKLGQEAQVPGAVTHVARPTHAQDELSRVGTVLLGPTVGPGPHQHAHAVPVPQVRYRRTGDVRAAVRRGAQQPAQQRLEQRDGVAGEARRVQRRQQFVRIPIVRAPILQPDALVQRLFQHHTPARHQRRTRADRAQRHVFVAAHVAHQHGVPRENQTRTETPEESGGRVQVSPEEIGTHRQAGGQSQSAEKRKQRTSHGVEPAFGTDMPIKTDCSRTHA